MGFEFANKRNFTTATLLIGLSVGAIFIENISNILLATTILATCLFVYIQDNGKIESKGKGSWFLLASFISTAVISFAVAWWFTGICWTYNAMMYFHVFTEKEIQKNENKGEIPK